MSLISVDLKLRCRDVYSAMMWLIDGYNLILSDEKLSKLFRVNKENAREELVRRLLASKISREKVALVFDGSSSRQREQRTKNIEIQFSSRSDSADDVIKKEVGSRSSRRSLVVVSNDRSIIGYAKECGAQTMSTKEFISILDEHKISITAVKSQREKPEPTGKVDPELLKLFSEKKSEG